MRVIEKIKSTAKRKFGSVRALSAILEIQQPAIYTWARVPVKHVLNIEAALDGEVTRYEMRPDVYGEGPGGGLHERL